MIFWAVNFVTCSTGGLRRPESDLRAILRHFQSRFLRGTTHDLCFGTAVSKVYELCVRNDV